MTKATKTPKLSPTMEDALVYLGRGVHRPHLEPEKRTVLALERRGMIVWSDRAELGAVGGYRVHDLTRLWDVTEAGWAFLAEAYGMERPADDPGRLTVEEALEDVVANDDRMYSAEEISARLRSAHRYGDGLLASPAYDSSGITDFLMGLGLAEESVENHGGTVKFYGLTPAGEEAARKNAKFHTDEDGDVLAAANFAARRPAAPQERGAVRQPGAVTASVLLPSMTASERETQTAGRTVRPDVERCGAVDAGDLDACGKCVDCTRPMVDNEVTPDEMREAREAGLWGDREYIGKEPPAAVLDALGAPLTAGQPVVVRRSLYNALTRSWEPQAPVEGTFHGVESNYRYVVDVNRGQVSVVVLPSEVTVDTRLFLGEARDLADLMRRTGLELAGCQVPTGWVPDGAWD